MAGSTDYRILGVVVLDVIVRREEHLAAPIVFVGRPDGPKVCTGSCVSSREDLLEEVVSGLVQPTAAFCQAVFAQLRPLVFPAKRKWWLARRAQTQADLARPIASLRLWLAIKGHELVDRALIASDVGYLNSIKVYGPGHAHATIMGAVTMAVSSWLDQLGPVDRLLDVDGQPDEPLATAPAAPYNPQPPPKEGT